MKTPFAVGVCGLFLAATALCIPQTVGGNGFLGAAGVSFEEFASDPGAWADGAVLKGHWREQGDHQILADSAVVFGVAADEITAQRQGGRLGSIRVLFRAGRGKPTNLSEQLVSNIRVLTGDSGTGSAGGMVFKYHSVLIAFHAAAGQVAVEFKPA